MIPQRGPGVPGQGGGGTLQGLSLVFGASGTQLAECHENGRLTQQLLVKSRLRTKSNVRERGLYALPHNVINIIINTEKFQTLEAIPLSDPLPFAYRISTALFCFVDHRSHTRTHLHI